MKGGSCKQKVLGRRVNELEPPRFEPSREPDFNRLGLSTPFVDIIWIMLNSTWTSSVRVSIYSALTQHFLILVLPHPAYVGDMHLFPRHPFFCPEGIPNMEGILVREKQGHHEIEHESVFEPPRTRSR